MTPLSPAAQAVLNEVLCKMCAGECESYAQMIAAATLRAAVDQVVPDEGHALPIHIPSAEWLRFDERKKIRAKFLAIAAELNGTTPYES